MELAVAVRRQTSWEFHFEDSVGFFLYQVG